MSLKIILFTFFLIGGNFAFSAEKKEDKFHFNLFSEAPKVFDATGKNVVPKHIIDQKYVILYFSASWCKPCHEFNPQFIKWYNDNGGGKDVEVFLVGMNSDTASIKKYMKDEAMPWLAFEKKGKQFDKLVATYSGKGIPCVVLLNEKDEVIAHSYEKGEYNGPRVALDAYEKLSKK